MSNMIYLDFPCAVGDGRQAANFRASSTSSDKLRKLQSESAALKRQIDSERSKRLAIEKQLAAAKPDVESLLAQLMAQVSGTWKGAAV